MPDLQKGKVYGAEQILRWFYDNVPLLGVSIGGVPLQLEPEARFGDLEGIARYVELAQANPAVVAAFGVTKPVKVRERKGDRKATYSRKDLTIAINSKRSAWADGKGWAMRELVVIHELAHHYAPCDGHGPQFMDTFVRLVGILMGPQASMALGIIATMEGVKRA